MQLTINLLTLLLVLIASPALVIASLNSLLDGPLSDLDAEIEGAVDGATTTLTLLLTALKNGQTSQNDVVNLLAASAATNKTGVVCPRMAVIFAKGAGEVGNVGFLTGPPFFDAIAAYLSAANTTASTSTTGTDMNGTTITVTRTSRYSHDPSKVAFQGLPYVAKLKRRKRRDPGGASYGELLNRYGLTTRAKDTVKGEVKRADMSDILREKLEEKYRLVAQRNPTDTDTEDDNYQNDGGDNFNASGPALQSLGVDVSGPPSSKMASLSRVLMTTCPDTQLVLAGYSVGALVVRATVAMLASTPLDPVISNSTETASTAATPQTTNLAAKISSIILVAEPGAAFNGTTAPASVTNLTGVDAARVLSLCHKGDSVCQASSSSSSFFKQAEGFIESLFSDGRERRRRAAELKENNALGNSVENAAELEDELKAEKSALGILQPAHLNYSTDAAAMAMFVMQKTGLGLASKDAVMEGMEGVVGVGDMGIKETSGTVRKRWFSRIWF